MDEVLGALAEARALGFLGPGPLDAHVASAEAFAAALGPLTGQALDLGSGGGVPGLLLAARFPDVRWVLLDRHRRRTSFLARAVAALGWVGRVEVLRAPAEEAAHDRERRGAFAAVVARSFGPPAVTAEIAVGFLSVGGRLVVAEPPDSDVGRRWPEAGVSALGLQPEAGEGTRHLAVFTLVETPPASVPRGWRAMERQPRW